MKAITSCLRNATPPRLSPGSSGSRGGGGCSPVLGTAVSPPASVVPALACPASGGSPRSAPDVSRSVSPALASFAAGGCGEDSFGIESPASIIGSSVAADESRSPDVPESRLVSLGGSDGDGDRDVAVFLGAKIVRRGKVVTGVDRCPVVRVLLHAAAESHVQREEQGLQTCV